MIILNFIFNQFVNFIIDYFLIIIHLLILKHCLINLMYFIILHLLILKDYLIHFMILYLAIII